MRKKNEGGEKEFLKGLERDIKGPRLFSRPPCPTLTLPIEEKANEITTHANFNVSFTLWLTFNITCDEDQRQ